MGGTITVKSQLGKGTSFIVTLPYKIADEIYYEKDTHLSESEVKNVVKGKHILLAEDNDLNAEIAVTLLEEKGCIIDRVEDGVKCVEKIEQKPAQTYDLILMDIQMPHMDGYEATQRIRHLPDKEKASIPIVAMTANAFEEDKQKAFSMGMNDHIAKPINIDEIERVLISIL